MNDISGKRILRWTLAVYVLMVGVAYTFGVGIASAETGSVSIFDTQSFHRMDSNIGGGDAHYLSSFLFYVTSYNSIDDFYTIVTLNTSMKKTGNYTFFTCLSPNICSGTVSYNKYGNIINWDFDNANTKIISAPNAWNPGYTNITLIYESNIFDSNNIDYGLGVYISGSIPNSTTPMCLDGGLSGGVDRCFAHIGSGGWNNWGTVHTSTTVDYNITYPVNNKYAASILKHDGIYSHIQLRNQSSVQVEDIGQNPYNVTTGLIQQTDGIYLNVSLNSSVYVLTLINNSGVSGYTPPEELPINPCPDSSCSYIYLDKYNYIKQNNAIAYWNIAPSILNFLFSYNIDVKKPDGSFERIGTSLTQTGSLNYQLSQDGIYQFSLIGCPIACNTPENIIPGSLGVIATTSASVHSPISFLYTNSSLVIAGVPFKVFYSYGYDNPEWATLGGIITGLINSPSKTRKSATINNVSNEINITLPTAGTYNICLDSFSWMSITPCTSVTAFSGIKPPQINVTVSSLNLSKNIYFFGDFLTGDYQIDNTNWSEPGGALFWKIYNTDKSIQTMYGSINNQAESFSLWIANDDHFYFDNIRVEASSYFIAGNNQFIIFSQNNATATTLLSASFNIITTNQQGYGLQSPATVCINQPFSLNVTVPVSMSGAAKLIIGSQNDTKGFPKTIYVNSSMAIMFYSTLPDNFNYILYDYVGNIQTSAKTVISSCQGVATPTPPDQGGVTQAAEIAALLTTGAFWSLIITAGLMIWIAYRTGSGFATGILGMLSMGVFTLITWLPAWIFYSVLIIAALLLAGSLVMKQSPYGKSKEGG